MNLAIIISGLIKGLKNLKPLLKYKRIAYKAFLGVLMGVLVACSVILYNKNKVLSERIEIANNNIEAYQGMLNGSEQANNVLKLDMSQLRNTNDKLLSQIDSVRKELKIKPKVINTVATQTQTIYVSANKWVRGQDIVKTILKDSIYSDTINYNNLTKVAYTIGKDTVSVKLDVKNQQFLYVYRSRKYKNKKSFLKRLFTLDFKKVNVYKYEIVNTNDLLKTSDVRVIESINK